MPDFDEGETRRVPRDAGRLRVLSVRLTVVDGPSRSGTVNVAGGMARIGSAMGNELRVDDRTVSRVHCELRVKADAVVVKDCGSTNGTYVEGVRLREGEVAGGTMLRLGTTVVRVDIGDEPTFLEVSSADRFGELVGASVEMRRLYAVLERVAPTDSTVLVQGETGTGKDVVARSLHAASRRAAAPFVPLDCGSVPATLFESELFGHARGAFTGAIGERKGVLEEANGGTLFLDEIGEVPMPLQSKLLRTIETRSVRPVGSTTERPIDVRIVAATNRSLARCVNEGTFREDLYYRLCVVEVTLPPLRARRDDVVLLAQHFYEDLKGPGALLPAEFAASLAAKTWPGNVRELRNVVERSVSLGLVGNPGSNPPRAAVPRAPASADAVVPLHLPLKDARQAWIESFEETYVRAMLRRTNGNVTAAAELAGVNRRYLQRTIARLGIRPADVGTSAFEGDDVVPGQRDRGS